MKTKTKKLKKIIEEEEIKKLNEKLENWTLDTLVDQFNDLPISSATLNGLNECHYFNLTEIQKESIGKALKGYDILGSAKTGSGKTLAFIIPLLETLFKARWTYIDGVGGLIITPTRELAYQIYENINKVGKFHDFSVALIIGGKDLAFERKRMSKCNIIICTPGRLLQHMDENPLLNCDSLKMLILDEADKILDLGFAKTMNEIIENIPIKRQTLLFSATQTKSVKDLARLSLKDPLFVSVHEHAKEITPENLTQSYIVCQLSEKLNALWSFIKNHLKQKILIFVSTCKQAKFIFELFCRMQPGISLLALYGSLHQLRRMSVYNDFCNKQKAVLFATDIAARGLDFPKVNWVVQLDCPEDAITYIHRVGRTARYHNGGESLLILLPSEEEAMIDQLIAKKVPINKIKINNNKMFSIQRKAEALLARDPELKESAQRAFKAYFKDVFFQKNKSIFKIQSLDKNSYAISLGLVITPRIRFLEKSKVKESNQDSNEDQPTYQINKLKKNFKKKSTDDNFENIFTVKKIFEPKQLPVKVTISDKSKSTLSEKVITKFKAAKKILNKNIKANKKIIFDKDGNPIEEFPLEQKSKKLQLLEEKNLSGIDIDIAKQIMEEEDKIDKEIQMKLIKEKHRERRLKLKEERKVQQEQRKKKLKPFYKEKEKNDLNVEKFYEDEDKEKEDDDEQRERYINELPDPDKIYNKKENIKESDVSHDDDESDSKNNEDDDKDIVEEEEEDKDKDDDVNKNNDFKGKEYSQKLISRNKRSITSFFSSNYKRKRPKFNDSELTLEQEEALAMHLISMK